MKKKLNLGVIIDSLDETDGGKYTYQINLLNKIININFVDLNISFFHFKNFTKPVGILNSKILLKIAKFQKNTFLTVQV